MFKKLLSLLSDALVYGVGGLLGQLISFLLLPIYTRFLDPQDYGVLAMLSVIPLVFSPLAAAGMKSAVFQRFHRQTSDDERRTMLGTALASVIGSSTLLVCAGIVAADSLSTLLVGKASAGGLVALSIGSAALGSLCEIPQVVLQATRRIKTVATLNILQLLVTVLLTIYFVVVLGWGVRGVVLGGLGGTLLLALSMLALTARSFAPRFDKVVWRAMAAYSLPFLPHRLLGVGMVCFGDYAVRYFLGLEEAGLYSVAARFAVPLGFAGTAIQQAWTPYKFKIFAEDPNPSVFFRSAFTYFFAGMSYLWLGTALWGSELLRLMTQPSFHAAATLVWLLALMRLAQATYPMMATGVELLENTRRLPLVGLTGLLSVVAASLTLIPWLGAAGAALSTTLAWLAATACVYAISQKRLPIHYDWPTVLSTATLMALFAGLGYQVRDWDNGPRLLALCALSLLYPVALYGVISRSDSERDRMLILWSRITRGRNPSSAK